MKGQMEQPRHRMFHRSAAADPQRQFGRPQHQRQDGRHRQGRGRHGDQDQQAQGESGETIGQAVPRTARQARGRIAPAQPDEEHADQHHDGGGQDGEVESRTVDHQPVIERDQSACRHRAAGYRDMGPGDIGILGHHMMQIDQIALRHGHQPRPADRRGTAGPPQPGAADQSGQQRKGGEPKNQGDRLVHAQKSLHRRSAS